MLSLENHIEIIVRLLKEGLGWDRSKSLNWIQTPNPNFGGCMPLTLIKRARGEKVLKFVISALEENNPPELKIEVDPK